MHRPFYGLTIQKGPWKRTPIDIKRENSTLKPTSVIGGGLGVGGTEHAGHDLWRSISTPKTNNPLNGINPAPTYKSVSVPHVVVNDGRPSLKGRISGGGIGNNYSRGGGKQGGGVFDSQNNRGDFSNTTQIVMNSQDGNNPDEVKSSPISIPTGAFGDVVEEEVTLSHMDPNSVVQPPPAPTNNNRLGKKTNMRDQRRRDIAHNAVVRQLRQQVESVPAEMDRQLKLQQAQFAQRENAQALLVSNQFQLANQQRANELAELRAQTAVSEASHRENLEQQAHTISNLEMTIRTKYDAALEALDRRTKAEEQTKIAEAAYRHNAQNQIKMTRLMHEESMLRQTQMAAENEAAENLAHQGRMSSIRAEATLAGIEKQKEALSEQIDQHYANADEMKIQVGRISAAGSNSIVNTGPQRITSADNELPQYSLDGDWELNQALAVREQVNPPNIYGGSGINADINIARSGGIILPPSKLKQGTGSSKLTKLIITPSMRGAKVEGGETTRLGKRKRSGSRTASSKRSLK